MKKIYAFIASILFMHCAMAQLETSKQVFESPKLSTETAKHKIVAILPYKVNIVYKRVPKNFDAAENAQQEKDFALEMQSGMYTYLLRKVEDFTVTVQDPERTNALLKKAGYLDRLDELTADSLSLLLKVDAVVKCMYKYEKTSSEGGALAKSILLGPGMGKVASSQLTIQLYNGADGELLWRFYKEMNEDVTGSSAQVMERMMRKVGRNFPYSK